MNRYIPATCNKLPFIPRQLKILRRVNSTPGLFEPRISTKLEKENHSQYPCQNTHHPKMLGLELIFELQCFFCIQHTILFSLGLSSG